MRNFAVLLGLIWGMSSGAWAVQNLAPECESFLLSPNDELYQGAGPLEVNDHQILVQGILTAFTENRPDAAATIYWSMLDEFQHRKIIPTLEEATYVLRGGDRLLIFSITGELVFDGYYGEAPEARRIQVGNRTHEVVLRWPGLWKDVDRTEPLIAGNALAELFGRGQPAVLIRTLEKGERQLLKDRLVPHFIAHTKHQLGEGRFLRINDSLTIETAHFEKVMEGDFEFSIAEIPGVEPHPNSGDLRDEMELAVLPRIKVYGDATSQKLKPRDELILLNAVGHVLYRMKLNQLYQKKPIIGFGPVSDDNLAVLTELMMEVKKAIVIRPHGVR